MDSIRAPYRVMIILFGLIVLVILRSFELWSRAHVVSTGGPGRRAVAAGVVAVIVALMFVEMQRPIEARWTRDELLSPALTAQVDQIRAECDAMILTDDATTPVWLTSIDAVILSTESGVPTPQGYSRSDPVGYPDQDAGVDANALVGWLRSEGFAGRACAVSPQGLQVLSDR